MRQLSTDELNCGLFSGLLRKSVIAEVRIDSPSSQITL